MQNNNNGATFLGVDLGGTKLLVGEIDTKGNILCSKKYKTGALTQQAALSLIENSITDYLNTKLAKVSQKPLAMGVGLVGRIDAKSGVWCEIDPQRMLNINAAQQLSDKFNIPCFIDNDVRSAAKAEMQFGYGQKSDNMIYINVGTGVAAGIVSGGRLINGGHFNAGEVGHTTSGVAQSAPCVCGHLNCVEAVASGSGLDKCARLLNKQYENTKINIPKGKNKVSAREIFELYETDELCRVLTDNAAKAIANLIMNLVRVTDPDTVVLGGGIMSDGFLYKKVLENIDSYTIRFVTNGIVLTKLNPSYIGLLGACSNAINGFAANGTKK